MTEHKEHTEEQEEVKPKLHKKNKRLIIVGIVVIILALVGFFAWLYTGQLSSAKESIFRKLPLPVALVQTKNITSKQLFARVDLAKKVLESTGQPSTGIEKQLLDQLIETTKIGIVAQNHNVKASSTDIENSFQAIVKKFPDSNEQSFEKTLQDTYGMNLATFKNEVVRQTVLQDNLKLWFDEQESLNNDAYNKARDLVKQLDAGTSFEEVAKKYSEDSSSKDFAGDSGFVKYSDMLPEFQNTVKNLAIGDTKIVGSRYGVHILRVKGIEGDSSNQNDKSYNLQQIFIQPADFSAWLKTQTDLIKSVKLL